MKLKTGDNFRPSYPYVYMLHFKNLLKFREQTNFTENTDMLEPVDLDHPLLKLCNPAHPDAKMMKY